jgi:hypothetical protein
LSTEDVKREKCVVRHLRPLKKDANPATPRYTMAERALKSPMEFLRIEQVVTKISTVILHKLRAHHFITVNSKEVKYFHDILALKQPRGMDGKDERGATFLQELSQSPGKTTE